MSRYIDADELLELYDTNDLEEDVDWKIPIEVVKQNIKDMPSVDVEHVRHGRWLPYDDAIHRCSVCGFTSHRVYDNMFKYCPNCGARMDGEEQEHEDKRD